jgi:hypothetical protein
MTDDKPFDCVEMKHEAALHVQTRLAGMSREEKVLYFRERTQALRELQRQLVEEQAHKQKSA